MTGTILKTIGWCTDHQSAMDDSRFCQFVLAYRGESFRWCEWVIARVVEVA